MHLRRVAMLLLVVGRIAGGQSATDHIALGDRDHAAGNLASALKHYQAAIRADSTNYLALTKAAHDAVDLGEFDPNEQQRDSLYRAAEDYARRAVASNAGDAEGHFELARALGRRALTLGKRDQVKFASEVYNETQAALKIDPNHAGANHVLGAWNEHIMELSGLTRMLARTLLGGAVFGEASWDKAQSYLERAVALEPARIVHRLDLAEVYAERNERGKALAEYEWIAQAPATDYNDRHYKDEAERRAKELR